MGHNLNLLNHTTNQQKERQLLEDYTKVVNHDLTIGKCILPTNHRYKPVTKKKKEEVIQDLRSK